MAIKDKNKRAEDLVRSTVPHALIVTSSCVACDAVGVLVGGGHYHVDGGCWYVKPSYCELHASRDYHHPKPRSARVDGCRNPRGCYGVWSGDIKIVT